MPDNEQVIQAQRVRIVPLDDTGQPTGEPREVDITDGVTLSMSVDPPITFVARRAGASAAPRPVLRRTLIADVACRRFRRPGDHRQWPRRRR